MSDTVPASPGTQPTPDITRLVHTAHCSRTPRCRICSDLGHPPPGAAAWAPGGQPASGCCTFWGVAGAAEGLTTHSKQTRKETGWGLFRSSVCGNISPSRLTGLTDGT